MNNVYFGKDGLTSTEANFLANVAKECIQTLQEYVDSVKFTKTSVSIIGSSDEKVIDKGIDSIDDISEGLHRIAEINSFCAWIREAIKEKEKQSEDVDDMELDEWLEANHIEAPVIPVTPRKTPAVTDKDVLDSWEMDKRNKYLRLEAFAATIGKYIHPNGSYSEARKNLRTIVNSPYKTKGEGRDTVLYHSVPTIDLEQVDGFFLKLQGEYRTYEKELNALKAEVKNTVNDINRKRNAEYSRLINEKNAKFEQYQTRRTELENQFDTWKTNELERISNLRIVIPEELKPTLEFVRNNVG